MLLSTLEAVKFGIHAAQRIEQFIAADILSFGSNTQMRFWMCFPCFPCIGNGFVWAILGVLSGAAARVTETWTVAGALLVNTLTKLITFWKI